MIIQWYGHSCFKLDSPSGSVVLDPYSDGSIPGLELPRNISADLVMCSHSHSDHNAEGLIALTGSSSSDIQVETLYAWHDDCGGKKRGINTVNIIMLDGLRCAHLGDIGCELTDGQVKAMGRIDALMLPVGGYYTIDAQQAKALADRINARVVIPMHYRTAEFGLPEIAAVDGFTSLYDGVEYLSGDTLEIGRNERPRVVVFSLVK